jgi:hypothetical protein
MNTNKVINNIMTKNNEFSNNNVNNIILYSFKSQRIHDIICCSLKMILQRLSLIVYDINL